MQVSLAENIACLAETALRFLEIVQLNMVNSANQEKETQFQYQVNFANILRELKYGKDL